MPHLVRLIVLSSDYDTLMDVTSPQIQPVPLNHTDGELTFASGLRFIDPTSHQASYSYQNNPVEVITYNNEGACIECLRGSQTQRVFLVVLSPVSETFIPQIITAMHGCGLGKSSVLRWLFIYVLRVARETMENQIDDYPDRVRIFGAKESLLAEVASDIADHFVILGQEQQQAANCPSLWRASNFFHWAETLYKRADDFESSSTRDNRLAMVRTEMTHAMDLLKQCNNGTNDIDESIAAGNTQMDASSEWHPDLLSSSIVCVERSPVEMHCASSLCLAECHISKTDQPLDVSEKSKEIGIFLLQSSIEPASCECIASVLKQLFRENLVLVREGQYYHPSMERVHIPIVILSSAVVGQEQKWKEIVFKQPPAIYVLGKAPESDDDRKTFFAAHPLIRAVTESPSELAVQIAVEVAMRNRILGDHYAREQKNQCATESYDQSIDMLNHLQKLADNCLSNKN